MKRRIAATLATASLAGAIGLAGAAPALAAPDPLSFTVDFTKNTSIPQVPNLGGGFAGNGPVFDDSGQRIGTVYDTCGIDAVKNFTSFEALCQAYVVFNDGDRLDLSTQANIELNPLNYPYTIKGVVRGGTGWYAGAQGEATITAQKPGVYDVDVKFK
ncbi:hypothetical protein AQJ91_30815 [Streptomyces dysideae]|uniref:Allene oxide cyclase barrel-like domain-containing protein n=1 Tax=Streptomyces dysideae TaxID=909626 RepID=A0A101UUT8_9ACTN|nr:hypothetical protein AQJ91_30815 [Streptomyces dysideae]